MGAGPAGRRGSPTAAAAVGSPDVSDTEPTQGADPGAIQGAGGPEPLGQPTDTFPRQYARTQRLTLGEPRTISVAPDGSRVVFCRSRGGSDPVNLLWVFDTATGQERLVADPRALLAVTGAADDAGDDAADGDAGGDDDLPAEERTRRERTREGAGGVVSYATDGPGTVAAFALFGRLFVAGLVSASARELPVAGPVFDPRPDPTARRVAYVSGRALRVAELDGSSRELAGPGLDDVDRPNDAVSWGSAEFVAAEEMGRQRGYWWSPDGERVAVARVDTSPVDRWYIADPANPSRVPTEHAYPAAGTDNADVTLHVVGLDGKRVDVEWDRAAFPYLAEVRWTAGGLHLLVQNRAQTAIAVLAADPDSGATNEVFADHDDVWVELVPGTPTWLDDGRLVMTADLGGSRRLLVDRVPVTPTQWQVRAVVGTTDRSVYVLANRLDAPEEQHLLRWDDVNGLEPLTRSVGVHTAVVGGPTVVVRFTSLEHDGARVGIIGGPEFASFAEAPLVRPNVRLHRIGTRELSTAVVLPRDVPFDARLPVLLDPYGGPHAQRVLANRASYLTSQWFADQGFAVVVIDGRGTPGRGSEWERAVHHDLAGPVLDDQVDALHALVERYPVLDLSRVAIRGWSFGGYLAALAVLRRPDVFHAAIAGAPVTDWRLYDTHYTERYLGNPVDDAGPYEACSLVAEAASLTRPLLLIHGLADDNVVAAHTLQLSSALLAAGRPHEVLPLSGVTHMTPQEVVAENLLKLQLDFLHRARALDQPRQ